METKRTRGKAKGVVTKKIKEITDEMTDESNVDGVIEKTKELEEALKKFQFSTNRDIIPRAITQDITNLKRELNSSQLLSKQDDDKATRSPKRKKQYLSKKSAGDILRTMEGVCDWHKASVASVLGHLCCHNPAKEPSEACNIISEIVNTVTVKKGLKKGLETLVPNVMQQYIKQFRIPYWVLLYFKIEAKILHNGWQTMINLTKLGRTGDAMIKNHSSSHESSTISS
ncbi:hypothetical protein ACROYT_G014393 [Oculina patagonica]